MNRKDKVFLNMATEISKLSKDEDTKVGAVIVDEDGKVVSMGYNGYPSNFGVVNNKVDLDFPHSRKEQNLELINDYSFIDIDKKFKSNKHPYMVHSEINCILTTSDNNRLKNATIYVTHYPCSNCACMIAQSGIKTVNCFDVKHSTFYKTIHQTLFIFENCGINFNIFEKL